MKLMHLPLADELDQSIEKFIQELEVIANAPAESDTIFNYLQGYFYPDGAGTEFYKLELDHIDHVDTERAFLLRRKLEKIKGSPLYRLFEEMINSQLKAHIETKHRSALYVVLNQCIKKPKPKPKKKIALQRPKGVREIYEL